MLDLILTISLDSLPVPSAANLMWFLAGLLVGITAPTYYASERIRGFSRAVLSKLPYKPPAGMDKEEALLESIGAIQQEEEEKQREREEEDGKTEPDS